MIKVDCLNTMGSDLSVVNAARVSFDKESWWVNEDAWLESDEPLKLSDKDQKLIKYLADHNHWSPFAHCFASFRIKAPIFVARQLQKHTVGLAWNEVSRRYVDSEPEFFIPKEWRKKAENKKQGSSEEIVTELNHPMYKEDLWGDVDNKWHPSLHVQATMDNCLWMYRELIESGVCPEQARMVLPQAMMTEWIWSGSLHAFARVCNLRLDPHAQKETREVAKLISDYMKQDFPVSWSVLVKEIE